jgi:23S rRNA pseudouridine2605 synthase
MSRVPVDAGRQWTRRPSRPIYLAFVRLAKYLAHAGVASRRGAERLIASGRVRVDGEVVRDPARDVDQSHEVVADGEMVRPEPLEYHLVNKPVGVVSTAREPGGRPKVTDLVDSEARLYPVGRLDAQSSGLILLTNDGELANRLMHPRYEVDKRYRVRVRGSPSKATLASLRRGVELEDGTTAPARVRAIDAGRQETVLEVVLHEGRKRILRRMFEAVGHPVIALERTGLGPLELGRLHVGGSRRLRRTEVDRLSSAATIPPREPKG